MLSNTEGNGGVCIITGSRPEFLQHGTDWYGKCCLEVDVPALVQIQLEGVVKKKNTADVLNPVTTLKKKMPPQSMRLFLKSNH